MLDRLHQDDDLLVMIAQFPFKESDLLSQLLLPGKHFSKLNKCPHHENADFDGFWGIKHAGCHNGAMLRKDQGHSLGKLEVLEVVAICDHLVNSSGFDPNAPLQLRALRIHRDSQDRQLPAVVRQPTLAARWDDV